MLHWKAGPGNKKAVFSVTEINRRNEDSKPLITLVFESKPGFITPQSKLSENILYGLTVITLHS